MSDFRIISVHLLLIAVLAACVPAEAETTIPGSILENTQTQTVVPGAVPEGTQTQPLNPLLTPEVTEMVPAITPDAAAQKMVDLAKEHLARSLSIPVDQISLVEVRPALWRDASLGCPKPSIDYMPVDTPGYNILLEAAGQTYNYHTDTNNRFVQCRRK